MIGRILGPYQVLAKLGAGGMGEVYRARDTRLDRTVAIKVLSSELAADPQLRDRFDREARAISSLNHPHICTLFDVGHQDGTDFLVLEYLEGETVAERLVRSGVLNPTEALKIAIDICDALDKAHRFGIVHRDLKPANVFLMGSGKAAAPPIAKLLDFGLAKRAAPVVSPAAQSMLPTTPPNLTAQGTILGTFQYMAPEQIEGLEADTRTDIFAFGALLFEMLTGRPAFEGKTRASLLGAILKDEPPPVSRVQPLAPASLDRIISTCLAKDPDDRYQSARDLLRDLKWVASGPSESGAVQVVTPKPPSIRMAGLIAATAIMALIVTAAIALRPEVAPAAGAVQFTIPPPENMSFGGPSAGGTGTATQLAVSPDGRNVVFVAGTSPAYQIWLRPIAASEPRPIPGTEGGSFPFWSPDSRFIAFFAGGKLKKVSIAGGSPIVLCDAPSGRGGSWSRDNVILFSPLVDGGAGLMRVSSDVGVPTAVTTLDPGTASNHRWPHFLPDGRHFFYTVSTGPCCPAPKPAMVRIGSIDGSDATVTLFEAESSVSYGSGHVVFARDDALMAQPFDVDTRQLTGDAFPLAAGVASEGSRYVSASLSENGTLVHAGGSSPAPQRLTWFDRTGRMLGTLGDAPYIQGVGRNLALSPDEKRVAVALETGNPQNRDIWIIDIARNIRSPRLTVDSGADWSPVWSPDGARIAFASERSGKFSLRQKLINQTATDELLLDGSSRLVPSDWSADGRFVAYTLHGNFPFRFDIWVLPLFGDRKPMPIAETSFTETSAVFSPNGRWMAYTSDQAGQPDVYVQPFPKGAPIRVSRDGGGQPVWRADGKELFFLAPDGTMMGAPIPAADPIDVGEPKALFAAILPSTMSFGAQQYAVTRDGERFLVIARPDKPSVAPLNVVINWTATIQN